jgi:hypothetical protein
MSPRKPDRCHVRFAAAVLAATLFSIGTALADEPEREARAARAAVPDSQPCR